MSDVPQRGTAARRHPATRGYLEAFGHIVIAWMWLEQIIATADREGSFYDGKRFAAQYLYRYELPKTGPQLDLLDSLDRPTVDISVDGFGA